MAQVTTRRTVEDALAEARAQLARLSPTSAAAEVGAGTALLVDIRGDHQRDRDGLVPGAYEVPRNVLEWRLDPACPDCDERLTSPRLPVILLCDEGYQSSLAAATLRSFGVNATDVEGGFRAWCAAGLPVVSKRRE
jgi:rhodanese-related sulfurtransferase